MNRSDKPAIPVVENPQTPDAKLNYTSVSQLQKADARAEGCLRAWFFHYVACLPDKPPSKAQQIGLDGHARWEHYYQTGQNVLTPLEQLALDRDLVPSYGTEGLFSEMSFADAEHPLLADGVPMVGYIDVAHLAHHHLIDFKYKSNPYKWMVQGPALMDPHHPAGIQMLGYGAWFRENTRGELADNERVVLSHVTFRTQGAPDVLRVDASVELGDLPAKWAQVCKVVPQMQQAATEKDGMAVEPNFEVCERYGGCAYMERCHDPITRLMAGFKAARLKIEGVDIEAKPGHSNTPETNREKNMGLMTKLLKSSTAPSAESEAPATTPAFDAQLEALETPQPAPGTTAPKAVGIVPPDAPPPAPRQVIELTPPAPAVENPPPARRGPGRPRKTPAPSSTSPSSPTPPSVVAGPPSPAPGVAASGIHLYVGCVPIGLATVSLLSYVEHLNTAICEAAQLPVMDLRCVDGNVLGFGKWKGVLKEGVRQGLPPPGHYTVTRGDERLDVVVNALEAILPPGSIMRSVG